VSNFGFQYILLAILGCVK